MLIKADHAAIISLKNQVKLLTESEKTGEPLYEMLTRHGLTYDDFLYEKSHQKKLDSKHSIKLSDLKVNEQHTPMVSFFTGCGGMDLGFEAAGYQHLASFELNELFCKTLRRNRPDWKVFGPPTHCGDVSNFEEVASTLSGIIKPPFDGVFIGGPPCQPFSIASNQRFSKTGENFKRTGFSHEKNGNLLFDYINLIIEFKPKAFVIENVPGLRDLDDGKQLQSAIDILNKNGYSIEIPFVLNAAHYGVPQQRFRLFVIGTRLGKKFSLPAKNNEIVGAGAVLNVQVKTLNHETREHKAESILRYMKLNYGERDQLGRVDRLDPTLPSKTVIAGGTKGGGRSHLHPEIPRTLSVRECARLQTFPDDFVFVGSSARQFTQVGNAVPPVLAAKIGSSIKDNYL